MIIVERLSKSFHDKKRGPVRAVDDVSFQVRQGEIYGLLGLNGAGKTTTLRMLATMLRPDAGTITINGHDAVAAPAAVRAQIGFLTGSTGLYWRLTPREIMAYFGRLSGMDDSLIRERSAALIERLGLHEFVDRRVDKLSAGQKQRASIARTLIHDPPVLILDEPTVGLDVVTSRAIVEFIGDAKTRGKSVLLSTHVMHEAARLCDRIGIIHAGRMRVEGTLEEFRRRTGRNDLDDIFVSFIDGGSA
ncbi:MAG TPA: ATP-binding cassette domain-containing protein [bacterium]|nr:ATP-binding cassette domain-containing protein [bacterium]